MAISSDLFMAILSMDAYNRGYNSSIVALTETSIGNATVGIAKGDQAAQDVSFYAQSYTWNGQTVIAYRGTDAF